MRIEHVKISTNATGNTTIRAAIPDQPIYLIGLVLFSAGTVSVKFTDGTTDKTGAMPLAAGGHVLLPEARAGWCRVDAGAALVMNLSAAIQVDGVAIIATGSNFPLV